MARTGILLDPNTQTIATVNVPEDGIAATIGADLFDVVRLSEDHIAFVDDEGLMKPFGPTMVMVKDYPQPLAGKVLVLGTDNEGETLSCKWTVEQVRERLTFGILVTRADGRILAVSDFGVEEVQ